MTLITILLELHFNDTLNLNYYKFMGKKEISFSKKQNKTKTITKPTINKVSPNKKTFFYSGPQSEWALFSTSTV